MQLTDIPFFRLMVQTLVHVHFNVYHQELYVPGVQVCIRSLAVRVRSSPRLPFLPSSLCSRCPLSPITTCIISAYRLSTVQNYCPAKALMSSLCHCYVIVVSNFQSHPYLLQRKLNWCDTDLLHSMKISLLIVQRLCLVRCSPYAGSGHFYIVGVWIVSWVIAVIGVILGVCILTEIWVIDVIWVILGVSVWIWICKIHGFSGFIEGIGFYNCLCRGRWCSAPTCVWYFSNVICIHSPAIVAHPNRWWWASQKEFLPYPNVPFHRPISPYRLSLQSVSR